MIKHWKKGIALVVTLLFGGLAMGATSISESELTSKFNDSPDIQVKYLLDGSTLDMVAKDDPKDKIKVTVGDKASTGFKPKLQLERWDEVNFSLEPKDVGGIVEDITLTDKIKWSKGNMDIEYYDYVDGEGGYKLVWYLKSKPTTNRVEFTIQSKDLEFFYQPPLTEEYQDGYFEPFKKNIVVTETQVKDTDGNILVERPENVVGSYAVYHATKGGINSEYGKDYKAGQAFMIYRPRIIDAKGNETWGILNIENGVYSVEIPQGFLDKAKYPIRSNDTFGYTTAGGSYATIYTYYAPGAGLADVSDGAGGTITGYSFYGRSVSGTITHGMAAYSMSSGLPNARLAAEEDVTLTTTADWRSITSLSQAMTGGTTYCVAYGGSISGDFRVYYNSVSNGSDIHSSSGALPATWSHDQYFNNRQSFYATYTPAAAGTGPEPLIIWFNN